MSLLRAGANELTRLPAAAPTEFLKYCTDDAMLSMDVANPSPVTSAHWYRFWMPPWMPSIIAFRPLNRPL